MKVSYKWLSDYVDLTGHTAAELAEKLTRSGIEVDIVEKRNKGVENVVVGCVKSRAKHPDADKLSVCVVDAGQGEDLQIVCGAKNVDAGQKVPVALVGAKLPDGLHIKRAKLRGVESQGMICSAKELGLNDRLLPKEIQEGILVLPSDANVGDSILDVLAIDDEVLELDLTPNRSDCLSMLGTAYEIAAILGREVRLPDTTEGLAETSAKAAESVSIRISAPEQCTHYSVRLLKNVQIGPSPLWMQNRLMAAGIRPINNVVDITNYVMLEYGQPLHAFDADSVANGRIDVRLAQPGERIVTLDDAERQLNPDMLLITDGAKPIGIAGVMGGANSEVSGATKRILLESAKFSGVSVRKTSRRLGLRSEASLRFEKEVNPGAVVDALNRAASLMCRYAGGQSAAGIAQVKTHETEPTRIEISLSQINGYLGTDLPLATVKDIFARLHFDTESANGSESLTVLVPTRRGDITRSVDLIEEIARLYGYDNIPTTLMSGVTTPGSLSRDQHVRRSLRTLLTQSGLNEVVSYSFTHPDQIAQFPGAYADSKTVKLSMPMSEERSTLRTSQVPHLLEIAVYNKYRNEADVAIFEIGKAFLTEEDSLTKLPEEKLLLSILMTGNRTSAHWSAKPEKVTFYDLKGIFERVVSFFGIEGVEYTASHPQGFHPGRTADISVTTGEGRTVIGRIGQLHPEIQLAKDLEDTYILEADLNLLAKYVTFSMEYKMLPRYPAVSRDLALVVDRGVEVGSLEAKAREAAGALLESVKVFDVYTGERLGADKKSVALSLVYRHSERTLTDEETNELTGIVVEALSQSFAAELRK